MLLKLYNNGAIADTRGQKQQAARRFTGELPKEEIRAARSRILADLVISGQLIPCILHTVNNVFSGVTHAINEV